MKKLCLVTALLLTLLCACQTAQPEPTPVNEVTQNGEVYTVDREAPTQHSSWSSHLNPAGFLVIFFGLFPLLLPEATWYLRHAKYGWRFADAKPSDTALVVERIVGGLLVIAGLFMLFS